MKAVVQRVLRAEVRVEGRCVARIERGALVLLGVMRHDGPDEARRLAQRIALFRFLADDEGRMNRSLVDAGAEVLVVSQITLAADGRRGRRPSLDEAAPQDLAQALYEAFVRDLEEAGLRCRTGVFRALMEVELVNDGPVTFALEEEPRPGPGRPSQALA